MKVLKTPAGETVFDMGQNFSGWARLRVQGPRGTDVRLRFAELLYENGTLVVDHEVLMVEGENQPGSLARLAHRMARHKVNIEYCAA